jgi:16S rRNA (uracil1498-N3)-methyltransferase
MFRDCDHPLKSIDFAIGPEGGFTETEIAVARQQGWSIVTLGPRILRVETAALYLAAAGALFANREET